MKAHAPSFVLLSWAGMLAIGCTWLSTGVAVVLLALACLVALVAATGR